MNTAYLYLQLYRLFDSSSPIPADCGRLCGKACCHGDEDSGMLLFPGEFEVYRLFEPDWMKLEKTDMTYTYNGKNYRVPLALCTGVCDRYLRPLACRIFPLTPHLDKDGGIEIITDPRAKSVCPLSAAMNVEEYSPRFLKSIRKTFALLMKNDRFKAFMQVYSDYLDSFIRFTD